MKKSELKSLIKLIVTESHDLYLGEEHPLPQDTHATDLNELAEDSGVVIQTVKDHINFGQMKIVKKIISSCFIMSKDRTAKNTT